MIYIYIWLVVSTPLKNMKVSWDDDILNIWTVIKAMFQTTNQIWYGGGLQPLTHIMVIMIMVIWYHGAIKWWYHITIIMKYQHDMGLNYNWENHYITMIYIYIIIYILYIWYRDGLYHHYIYHIISYQPWRNWFHWSRPLDLPPSPAGGYFLTLPTASPGPVAGHCNGKNMGKLPLKREKHGENHGNIHYL